MAFATVTGCCWPQTVTGGGTVGLHLSSAGARPDAVEVARVGGRSPEDVLRVSHGHAVLGTYTSPAGGVVVFAQCHTGSRPSAMLQG